MYWKRPFKIGTIQNPNLKIFGIGMVLGILSSDFEPPLFLLLSNLHKDNAVTRLFCLVESRSQDAAVNAGVLSVYLTMILCLHPQLFIDIEKRI